MLRTLFTRVSQYSTLKTPCSSIITACGVRSYVTRTQSDMIKTKARNAPMVLNPEIGIPIPVFTEIERNRLREDPLVSQLVNLIMRDGKKMQAERLVKEALLDIRKYTNTDPFKLLSDAIDLASPLMDTRSGKIGSKVIQIPRALNLRQRRRKAIIWLLESCDKRGERHFHHRLSGELQAIVNGNSSVLPKKLALHRLVIDSRSNIRTTSRTFGR
ncbi:ribosomal protein S7 [Coemansia reversa NRRL 1564]|uniref:Ribosomal protein S7 n=1 Tax=Coemansia reversa (strain ATCC 12441 / NRRL 1564) TaxID=763665 RepID=A0A2G5B376_COERN|nr:ribosomal protein S7 [Coemansia reversa NRRL 1564]|eukprot:PIA13473.1 ribosomal protein S7 [Coemansia reversa NRRL 1564]